MACASCSGAKGASMRQQFLGPQRTTAPASDQGIVRRAVQRPEVKAVMSTVGEPFVRPPFNDPAVETDVDTEVQHGVIVMVIGDDGTARPLEEGEEVVIDEAGLPRLKV